jgi:LPXTG-motif cell wall-anchored protein
MTAPTQEPRHAYYTGLKNKGWKPIVLSDEVDMTKALPITILPASSLPKSTAPDNIRLFKLGVYWVIRLPKSSSPQTPDDIWWLSYTRQSLKEIFGEVSSLEDTAVTYTPDTAPRTVNWWLLGGVAVVAIGAILLWKRK